MLIGFQKCDIPQQPLQPFLQHFMVLQHALGEHVRTNCGRVELLKKERSTSYMLSKSFCSCSSFWVQIIAHTIDPTLLPERTRGSRLCSTEL